MAFDVEFTVSAGRELKVIRASEKRRIVDEIEEQLTEQPAVATRNRKCLVGKIETGFEHIPPLWELRVGEYRVFYDVDSKANKVYVRAVRRKAQGQTTEDIL